MNGMALQLDTSIFKAYDIRGVYPESLNEELAYKIAVFYADILKRENGDKKLEVVVGRDMRLSSVSIQKRVIGGLIDFGVDVVDVGLISTPSFYFAVGFYGYDGGIQVSASHNPSEYNGLKMVRGRAVPMGGDSGIYEIRDRIASGEEIEKADIKGEVIRKEGVVVDEVGQQTKDIDVARIAPFKIVVDTANAMAVLDIEEVFKITKCDVIYINKELDGTFPNHPADPLKEENLEMIKKKVLDESADLGIATDGDGDRYFFVNEKGEVMPQPILRGLMAQIELSKSPGATVCYDIRPGRITRDMIEEAGGKGVVTKVGHSLIKEKMLEVNAVFGGESSGHYFYKFDYGTFEAPIVLTLKLLEYLSRYELKLSQVVAKHNKYFHSGEINSEVEDKEGKMRELADKYSDGEVSWLDGVTVEYPDFWFNVRASNTEPLLRLNLEAKTKKLMEQKRDEVLEVIRAK